VISDNLSAKPLAKAFVFCFYLISQKTKSKDLAFGANTPKPLNTALTALFVIAVVCAQHGRLYYIEDMVLI